jgi:hypothetical protein
MLFDLEVIFNDGGPRVEVKITNLGDYTQKELDDYFGSGHTLKPLWVINGSANPNFSTAWARGTKHPQAAAEYEILPQSLPFTGWVISK